MSFGEDIAKKFIDGGGDPEALLTGGPGPGQTVQLPEDIRQVYMTLGADAQQAKADLKAASIVNTKASYVRMFETSTAWYARKLAEHPVITLGVTFGLGHYVPKAIKWWFGRPRH